MTPTHRNEYALLQQVQVRQQARRIAAQQFARQLAPDFSLLEYLRRNEMAISEYLSLLLDPAGSHGQGPLFLHRFLQVLSVEHPDASWTLGSQRCRIQREKSINGGRMDIHLELDRGCICIENKPWAADQIGQLQNYARHLESAALGRPWMLVYLCSAGPSSRSIDEKSLRAMGRPGAVHLAEMARHRRLAGRLRPAHPGPHRAPFRGRPRAVHPTKNHSGAFDGKLAGNRGRDDGYPSEYRVVHSHCPSDAAHEARSASQDLRADANDGGGARCLRGPLGRRLADVGRVDRL
ncbi:hypothetical protein AVME950_14830 [Acidovorax sp. SUPP950]|uniref:PDDEXK-like family protein n=1 Tax=Acidovorax sp. SUPP950 TaxID=511901 RepID=UPI0023CABB2F|nr:PD-(D/E)XK nuclease family protein [Acidovorax sp. SUPP950]GKS76184.1 hypothetical protein AVME950_14830 [Acidovorax sp. SUPP950]